MERSNLSSWCAVFVLTMGWSASATGDTYCNYYDYSGTWSDANKTWDGDTQLCWAAAASNILAWGGWGTAEYDTADEIFEYMKGYYPDAGGSPEQAYDFWFRGSFGGGGFYPGLRLADYYDVGAPMQDIDEFLHSGNGVHIRITSPLGGHALTVWGYEYDPAYEPGDSQYYTGLYFTDSDDHVTELQMSAIRRESPGGGILTTEVLQDGR